MVKRQYDVAKSREDVAKSREKDEAEANPAILSGAYRYVPEQTPTVKAAVVAPIPTIWIVVRTQAQPAGNVSQTKARVRTAVRGAFDTLEAAEAAAIACVNEGQGGGEYYEVLSMPINTIAGDAVTVAFHTRKP